MTGRQLSPTLTFGVGGVGVGVGTSSLYGLAPLPAAVLSPTVAGLGLPVGVGIGYPDAVIGGGVTVYWLGQIGPRIPADANGSGGFPTLTTPIRLLYRGLLGSALANIGAWARADIPTAPAPDHSVAGGFVGEELMIVNWV